MLLYYTYYWWQILLLYYIKHQYFRYFDTRYILNSHRCVQLLNSLEIRVVSAIFIDECYRTREPFWSTLENTSLRLLHQPYFIIPSQRARYIIRWPSRRAHAATYYDKYLARAIRRDRRDRLPKTVKYFRDSHNLSPWLPTPLDERVPPRPRLTTGRTKHIQPSWIVIGISLSRRLDRSINWVLNETLALVIRQLYASCKPLIAEFRFPFTKCSKIKNRILVLFRNLKYTCIIRLIVFICLIY